MGRNSGIEWTDHTWNPWRGCIKVSAGCANCYMYREQRRWGKDPRQIVLAADRTFQAPLRWKEPARVFTCSWSDFFLEEADEWRPKAWEIIRQTPHLTYQILTKRPYAIRERLPADWGMGYENVWLGVSVELQNQTFRLDYLAGVPARVKFLSAEPLLGPLNLGRWLGEIESFIDYDGATAIGGGFSSIDWVIVGGESGPGARPMSPNWAQEIRRQCSWAGVPYFFKQWGAWMPLRHASRAGVKPGRKRPVQVVDGHFMQRVGRKAAGRELDGKTYDEYPEATHQPQFENLEA